MDGEIERFLHTVSPESRREDAFTLLSLLSEASGYTAYLTGTIIGFGSYHYRYDSGREGDWFVTGFSPRKQHLAIYILPDINRYGQHLESLGKHKTGRSCLYVKTLADIDPKALKKLVRQSVKDMQTRYACKDAPIPER